MSYNLRNYKVLGISLCLLFNLAICNQVLNAQVQACPILVPIETTMQSENRYFNNVNQEVQLEEKVWTNLAASKRQDDNYASVTLAPGEKSTEIRFDQFGFNVPIGTTIHGVEIRMEGHTEGLDPTSDVVLQLLDQGNPLGMNLANGATYGTEWNSGSIGDDASWSYGAPWYQWGSNWGMNQIMDSGFGFRLQVENTSDEVQTIRLDQVEVIVHYMPLFKLCDHDCVAFYVDDAIGADYYNWIMPDGFEIITGQPNEDIINIHIADATPGIHTICVETVSAAGTSGSCCRDFLYDDCRPSSVGDKVWFDKNGDGIQDANEGGIENTLVQLYDYYDNLVAEVTTDVNGTYLFSELEKGDYYIKIILADTDFIVSATNVGSDDLDSDLSGENGVNTSNTFYLNPGEDISNLDFGFTKYNSISGLTWDDLNLDGIRQNNEPTLANVTVVLLDGNNVQIDVVSTDSNGGYLFVDLYPGDYNIVIAPFKDFVLTLQNVGLENVDSDFDSNGEAEVFTLACGIDVVNIDAGFNELGSIGNQVWRDKNGNGIQEDLDVGVSQVVLNLFDSNGFIASTTTGADGTYLFDDLKTGDYYVQIEGLTANYIATTPNIGEDDLDSDLDDSNGLYTTGTIYLAPGDNITHIDLGLTEYGGIIGQAWNDLSMDGTQDPSEPNLANIQVDLFNANGVLVESTITGSQGSYAFGNVFPGDYTIKFNTPIGFEITFQNVGNQLTDSDINQNGETKTIVVMAGMMVGNINAGYIEFGSVGDFVWFDKNGNGVQENTELGLEGIEVNLHNLNGTIAQTKYTSTTGEYLFENVSPGTYFIKLGNLPNAYQATNANVGDDSLDSDMDDSNGPFSVSAFDLTAGQDITYIDLGFTQTGSIQGLTWGDKNLDGIRGSDDFLLKGITVKLLNEAGEVVDDQTTGQDGSYSFDNVYPGNYTVEFGWLPGLAVTNQNIGSDAFDSDMNAEGATETIVVCAGDNIINIDGGYIGLGAIGDRVWFDTNGNGLQDSFDANVALTGMLIHLYLSDGTLCQTVTLDDTGHYAFENLFAGMYYVRIDITGGFTPTRVVLGDEALDNDLDEGNGLWTTSTITLLSGEVNNNIDLGLTKKGLIKGTTFIDLNRDGINQDAEPIMPDVKVTLLDENGNVVDIDYVEDGCYTFGPLFPGYYQMLFEALDGSFMPTLKDIGIEFTDSDIDENGFTNIFFLGPNEVMGFYDAGFFQYGSISGTIWNDDNENGIEEVNEEIFSQIVVYLMKTNGQIVQTVTTDDNGYYLFSNLLPDTYFVRLEIGNFYEASEANVGTDDTVDSDFINLINNVSNTEEIYLQSGDMVTDFDGGFYLNDEGSICGVIWEDMNFDGIRQASEPLILETTKVSLYHVNGTLIAEQTLVSGTYSFENISPGDYYVEISSGVMFYTLANIGSDDLDSDIDDSYGTGTSDVLKLDPQEKIDHVDAGFYETSSIAGTIWNDIDENGIQYLLEEGVQGIVVNLIRFDGQLVDSKTTDDLGNYLFTDVLPSEYVVQFDLPDFYKISATNVGTDESVDSDFVTEMGSTVVSHVITIQSGDQVMDIDAGVFLNDQGSICGVFWEDLNYDGIRQDTEPLIDHFVAVRLYDENDVLIDAQAVNSGSYTFNNISPGNYYLQIVSEMMMTFTLPNVGSDDLDSDVDQINGFGTTDIIVLNPLEKIDEVDAGFYSFGSLSGDVWFDENCNGEQDFGEMMLDNIEVYLVNDEGQTLPSTFTNEEGEYYFSVIPDFYTVNFVAPNGLTFTAEFASTNIEWDSDVISESNNIGSTNSLEIISGSQFTFIDAGMKNIARVSGNYWNDLDCNGVQNGEPAVFNALVELFDSNNVLIESKTTDNLGWYSFENVPYGEYYLVFQKPSGFNFTESGVGTNPDIDSDVVIENLLSGNTDLFELMIGSEVLEFDAGLKLIPDEIKISGLAWVDQNCDGIRNNIDSVIPNMVVNLLDDTGVIILTTMTNDTGEYLFEGMDPGSYQVSFESTSTMFFTEYLVGTDENIDSDVESTNGQFGFTPLYALIAEESIENIDAGLKIIVNNKLQGTVWLDENCNGLLDPSELGIPGVIVNLYDVDGNLITSTSTSAMGEYLLFGMFNGDYVYEFILPDGYKFTEANIGTNEELDSDVENFMTGLGTTGLVTIAVNENISNINAGLKIKDPIQVSGIVFVDENCDGQFNTGEGIYQGLNVVLVDWDGVVIGQTITDENGYYLFTDLMEGTYAVLFDLPAGYTFTTVDLGDDATDSDVVATALMVGTTNEFTLVDEQQLHTVFAGLKAIPVDITISGLAWIDQNNDGIRNAMESVVPNVPVSLLDDTGMVVLTTMTNSVGEYLFEGMDPGTYQVSFEITSSMIFTDYFVGTDETINSDVENIINGQIGSTPLYTLSAGATLENIDAGLKNVTNNVLQGMVWIDENCNGLMDPDEPGVPGAGVNLYDIDGVLVSSSVTAPSGQYFMVGLFNGEYVYEFVLPANYNFTLANVGTNEDIDSDVENFLIGMGTTGLISIGVNQSINNVDAGLKTKDPIEVGGLVFIDENCDGQFNADENIVSGLNVVLVDINGVIQGQTTTDTDGNYNFTNLFEGTYKVLFELTDGYKFTTVNVGDDATDSDVTAMTSLGGTTEDIVLVDEQQLHTVFAGIKLLDEIAVSGSVWNDLNCNGLSELDEPTMMNIQVNLLDGLGNLITTAQTDATGNYMFSGMAPGDYQVEFILDPGYEFTLAQQGTDTTIDSDVININGIEGATNIISLVLEDQLTNIDAGFKEINFININGTVWEDINGNGLRNMNEMGEAGITVELYDDSNVLQGTDMTDAMGNYQFSNFPQGTYYVVVVLPSGSQMTLANQGTNDLIDSDITSAVVTNSSELISNSIQQLDAGFFYFGSIGDFAWSDDNGNGIQDTGETGINSLMVRLFDINGNLIATKFTGGNFVPDGEYLFTDVAPGFYYISHTPSGGMLFSPPNVGGDDNLDSDINSANGFGTSHTITILSGMDDTSVDIGLIQEPGSLGDRVWLDINANGIQESGENGINDVLVTLKKEDGTFVASTVTDFNNSGARGYYDFTNIQPGSYYIVFTVPTGHLISPVDQGGNDTQDSDLTSGMEFGSTNIFNLSAGENEEDIDAGFYQPASLGDFVWDDLDQDGIQDANEPGVANVIVNLHAFNGALIMSTQTDADGFYTFPFLAQGVYFISVVPPLGLQFTSTDQGTDDMLDSDVDPTGTSSLISLAHAVTFHDMDVGLVPANAMLGLRVWYDEDGDGVRDNDELGMNDIDVRLMNTSGTMMYETTTNLAGKYIFENIPSGTYYVQVDKPSGYEFTDMNMGGNDDLDSDFDASGNSVTLTVNSSTQIMNIDAGLVDEENILEDELDLAFVATKLPSTHRLEWSLNDDAGISSMLLERKLDGEEFKPMAIIDESMYYRGFEDDQQISRRGDYTYRLKITTDNHSVVYSQEEILDVYADVEHNQLTMYPVPAVNTTTLELKLVEPSSVAWTVYNSVGKVVLTRSLSTRQEIGIHYYQMDVTPLTSGNYFVKVQLERESLIYNISINK